MASTAAGSSASDARGVEPPPEVGVELVEITDGTTSSYEL